MTKEQWRQDLQYLAKALPKRHKNAFHTITREQGEGAVAALDAAIPSLNDHQIIVRMLQISAKIGDAHTYVPLPLSFKRYPLQLYWFGNELRVTHAANEYQDALGARLIKIGNLGINDVPERILSLLLKSAQLPSPQTQAEW